MRHPRHLRRHRLLEWRWGRDIYRVRLLLYLAWGVMSIMIILFGIPMWCFLLYAFSGAPGARFRANGLEFHFVHELTAVGDMRRQSFENARTRFLCGSSAQRGARPLLRATFADPVARP